MKIKKIESRENEKIKYLKKLSKKSFRDERGEFLVENLRIIHDALKAGITPISFFVTDDVVNKGGERLKYVLENINEVFVINQQVNKYFSEFFTAPGIAAVYGKSKNKINFNESVVYLNAVSDPGNLGTILRTALAFDIKNIVVDEGCADIYNSKTISAARDAIFKLNIFNDYKMEVFDGIKRKMKVYATRLEGGIDIDDVDMGENFCVVFGNEANGVTEDILSKSDEFIRIDMNNKIESLNVAVTAGIVFYKIYKSI